MSSALIITILTLVGLLLLVLELLILPGGIVGAIGVGSMIAAVIVAYTTYSATTASLILAAILLVTLVAIIIICRTDTWKKLMLTKNLESGGIDPVSETALKVGDCGRTISRLAPMGKAVFDEQIYEVSTLNDFIDQNQDIVISKIEGNKIIVKLK